MKRCIPLLFVSALAGCVMNPATGRRQFILVPEGTERELGREQAEQVPKTMGLVENERLTDYVRSIGQRLVAQSTSPDASFEFHVVDMAEPNAFALPGGYIYISRGLLALSNSEDELACVVGHEIAHVLARHAAQRISRGAPLGLLTGIASMATSIASPLLGDVIAGVGGLTNELILAPYSRDQEREADRLGIELAARAGWDPSAMAKILHGMELDEQSRGHDPARFNFLASHPSTPERVQATRELAASTTRATSKPVAADRAAFLAQLDGLVIGESAAQGILEEQLFLHPDFDLALTFPDKWKVKNSRNAVGATEPNRDAFVLLQGSDAPTLDAAVANFQKNTPPEAAAIDRLKIADLPAAHTVTRVQTDKGILAIDITWIEHAKHVFEVVGITNAGSFGQFQSQFRQTASTFRPLTSAEKGRIQETRLRVEKANGGERIDALVARLKPAWTAQEVSIANQIDLASPLKAGQLLKVARRERYR